MNKTTRILLPAVGALLVAGGVFASDTRTIRAEPKAVVAQAQAMTVIDGGLGSGSQDPAREIDRATLIVLAFFAGGQQLDADRRSQVESYRRDLQTLRRNLTEPDFIERGRKDMILAACVRLLDQGLRDGHVDAQALEDWQYEIYPLTVVEKPAVQIRHFQRIVSDRDIVVSE